MKIALCAHCGTKFKPRRGKRYCSDKCRFEAYHITVTPCYYCGCPATTIDHIPPQSVRPDLISLGITKWDFIEVEACHECNCALGARALWTLPKRKEFMKDWIRRRYAKYLAMPEWSENELKELGYNLESSVTSGQIIARLTRQRLKW